MGRRGLAALGCGVLLTAGGLLVNLQHDGSDVEAAGDWVYVAGTTRDGRLAPPARELPTLTIHDDRAGGHTGCNSYGARLDVDGSQLSFEPIEQTLMGCDGAVGSFERGYLAALGDVTAAQRRDDRLVLTGDGLRLEFDPVPDWPDEAVVGRTWRLHALTDDSSAGDVVPAADRDGGRGEPAMLYLSDGRITASTGCRRLTGRWTEFNGALVLTRATYTGACGSEPPQQEIWVTEVLSRFTAEVTVRDGGHELVLTAARAQGDGSRRQLVYRR